MNLRRQLFLVSLLTLVLPWAGCQFVRETESALREGQQSMLDGTAQAIADSLSQFPADFLRTGTDGTYRDSQIYVHPLEIAPLIDGYADDWTVEPASMRTLRGAQGEIRYVFGAHGQHVYILVEVRDAELVYADPRSTESTFNADSIELESVDASGNRQQFYFLAEAPGALIGRQSTPEGLREESRMQGEWLETPFGYRVEGRIPRRLLDVYLGLSVINASASRSRGLRSTTFDGRQPGRLITVSPVLSSAVSPYAQDDLRLIVVDRAGWRLATAGRIADDPDRPSSAAAGWMRIAYNALLEPGTEARFAEPNPLGREREAYIAAALNGESASEWFRSAETGRAVVAVAKPVWSGSVQTGAVILQQGTEAILSLTNTALGRLVNLTLIATVGVAVVLLGYASWLSLRIRRLSSAAEVALDDRTARISLPSAAAGDEVGDLSRSFSSVLQQLRSYNDYLRTLASKLSHELRTPLTIVNSSLENLEHETLSDAAALYTARARDGAVRLKKVLDAMSEATRVEALMQNIDPEAFDLKLTVESATSAYADAWPKRQFRFDTDLDEAPFSGSPELLVQLLDKLIDNAVGFSQSGDEIVIGLGTGNSHYEMSVYNPGPPLPDTMREQLFDSMVSVRPDDAGKHLGLGLHIARIIAAGHGGRIGARNEAQGVLFTVRLPRQDANEDAQIRHP